MQREDFLENYWRFYLSLENKFMGALMYVELCESNYGTYSIEFVSQILEIGSEIDVIMKELCDFKQEEKKDIRDYKQKLCTTEPEIIKQEIVGKRINIIPFGDWGEEKKSSSLFWWKNYNNIKHGRVMNYKQANLQTVFYSLGALFILENFLLRKITNEGGIDIVDKDSLLFKMNGFETRYCNMNDCLVEKIK